MEKTKQNGVLKRLRKNIMCGVLSCVLALGAVLIMPGMTAKADNIDFNDGNIKYSLNSDDRTAIVEGPKDKRIGPDVRIPAIIEHAGTKYHVTEINRDAFNGCLNIKKIIIEEGIKCIGCYAFVLSGITEIEIPASVNEIEENIFCHCNIKKICFKGTTPPRYIDSKWLENVNNNNITIEIPDDANRTEWENALHLSSNITLKGGKSDSSSSSSTTSSSPSHENNSDGEIEVIEEEPVNRIPAHVCQYEWEVVREVSADQDGLEQYLCKLCGNVQSTLTVPASHYQVQELYTKVTGAGEGETVTYDLGSVHTICDKLFTKLQERKDITLVITYQYKGESYRTTFPAGADYTELMQDTDQFYGMLGLNGRCGIVTEKN